MNTTVSPAFEHLLVDSLFSSLYTQANFSRAFKKAAGKTLSAYASKLSINAQK